MDARKIRKFSSIKNPAGIETQRLSFNEIRTISPLNINSASPSEDRAKINSE